MIKKSLAWVAGLLLIVSVVVALLVYWLLKSESGLQWALARAGSTLSVQHVSGNATAMRLRGVRWSNPSTEISVDELILDWRSLELLDRRIRVDKLLLNKLQISTRTEAKTDASPPWSGIAIPIDVFLAEGVVKQFSLHSDDNAVLSIDKIELAAGIENNLLRIRRLNIAAPQGQASITGKLDLAARNRGQVDLKNRLSWQFDENRVSSQGAVNGSWGKLNVLQNIKDGQGRKLNLSGTITDPLQLQGLANTPDSVQSELDLQGDWALPFTAQQIGLEGNQALNRGSVTVTGTPNAYRYKLESETAQEQLPLVTAEMDGNGDLAGVTVASIRVGDGESNAQGKGELRWSPTLQWRADLQLEDFTPAKFYPALINGPESLNGNLNTSGTAAADANNPLGILGELKLTSMQGVFNKQALSFDAEIQMKPSKIVVRSINGSLGSANFFARAALGEQITANWRLEIPNLTVFDTKLAGQISASGDLGGTLQKPRFTTNLEANNLRYTVAEKSWQLETARVAAQATTGDMSAPLKLDASIQGIAQNGTPFIPNIETTVRGNLQRHSLTLHALFAKQTEANLAMKGGFDSVALSRWSGRLTDLSAVDINGLAWQLEKAAKLDLSASSQTLNESCVSARGQRICLSAQLANIENQPERNIHFTVKDFSLATFEPLLVLYDIKPDGRLNGQLSVQQTAAEQTQRATLGFFSDDFRLRVPLRAEEGAEVSDSQPRYEWLDFNELILEAEQAEQINLSFSLSREDGDGIRGNANLATNPGAEDWQSAPLAAEITARVNDLSILPPQFLADLQLNGALDANFQVSGSVADPRIAIRSELSEAAVFIPVAGLDLQAINITVESTSESEMTLQGSLKSGEGTLNLDGTVAYQDIKNPSAELRLKGEDLDFIQTGDIDAVGTLDLLTKFANQTVSVEGNVLVQKANLKLGASENVVSASDDVIIEGQEPAQSAIKQRLRLNIDLGEKTHLQAAGLDADLVGKLTIVQLPGELMTGSGRIEIKNGYYRAYGEELEISRGRLIFNGTSIDDPGLELNAIKTVDDIEAGVRVRGRAQAPVLSLFSTPSMTDQDILSVLIFGKPVSDLASQDSLTLLKIAASLRGNGPDQFSRMTSRLQDMLGLTNLELRLTGDAPEVVAGKQLSSRFYIGYGYGLLDAVQSIVLRYKISEAWSVQGDFGADSGADLRYQLER